MFWPYLMFLLGLLPLLGLSPPVAHSVVPLHIVNDLGEDFGQGTAFFISNTLVATAKHNYIGEDYDYYLDAEHKIRVVLHSQSDEQDVMLFRLAVPLPPSCAIPVRIAKRQPEVGDELMTIGFALGTAKRLALWSRVSAQIGDIYLADGTALPGLSGSPVVNKKSEVVGVMVAGWGAPTGHSLPVIVDISLVLRLQ